MQRMSPEMNLQPVSLERMVRAVEKVRQRLLRVTAALDAASIPYAVVGGHAVAAWVARVDESAVRNTQDVDLLLDRSDLERTKEVLARIGFIYRYVKSIDMFLDGPEAKARDAVHIVFAGEKVRTDSPFSAPTLDQTERAPQFMLVSLPSLVTMKLTSFRDKDRVHVRDLIDVGLVDSSWLRQLPPPLAERLQQLIDTPDG